MAPHDHAPTPPAIVTDGTRAYQTGRLLGKGAFGIVHEARIQGTETAIALKVFKTKLKSSVGKRVIDELRIHSKVDHVGIVRLIRAFTDGPATYIVLELCSIGDLKEMQRKRGAFSSPEVRYFTTKIICALSYLHSRSIIHRDLKLGNIFLDANMEPKLGDFGLAQVLMTDREEEIIRRRTVCGTPNYMAPEVLDKDTGHSKASDIWTLGILIYYQYVTKGPFQQPGDNHQDQILARVRDADYEWPKGISVPAEAKDLVSQILVNEDERLDLDRIIEHNWFRNGSVPRQLEVEAFTEPPKWLTRREPRDMKLNAPQRTTSAELLKISGFVPGSTPPHQQNSVFRALDQEESDMRTPSLPLTGVYEFNASVSTGSTESTLVSKHKAARWPKAPKLNGALGAQATDTTYLKTIIQNLSGKTPISSVTDDMPSPVLQWAHDSKGYGVGLALTDGTAICILLTDSKAVAIAVPNAVEHYRTGRSRHASVPSDVEISFFERDETGTLQSHCEPAATFLNSSITATEDLKLWTRYTRYITGKIPNATQLDAIAGTKLSTFPTTLQFIGNVRVWIWTSGATQWEFPDHRKMIISSIGTEIRFWTADASVDWQVRLRDIYSSPSNSNKGLKSETVAFKLDEKLAFVRDVVRMWRAEGAIGLQGRDKLSYNAGEEKERDLELRWSAIRL